MRIAAQHQIIMAAIGLNACSLKDTPQAVPLYSPAAAVMTVSGETAKSDTFPTSTEGLPEAKPMQIVELADGDSYTFTASPVKQKVDGQWIRRLAYNGSVPGPILKVKQGATVRVTLKNLTDVPTSLHPHGLRLDYHYDGVIGVGQMKPIAPGESFEYVLKFPDAGMYWYHPHIREDYSQGLGMYGNFWVTPRDPQYYNPVHREVALLIDDASVKDAASFYRNRVTHTLMGRYGDVTLINGQDAFQLNTTVGEVVRLYLTNTANTRTIKFALPGARIKLVGSDAGLFEHETWVDNVIVAPSERYIVEIRYDAPGTFDILNNKPGQPVRIGKVVVAAGSAKPLARDFNLLRSPVPVVTDLAKVKRKLDGKVDKYLTISLLMKPDNMKPDHGMAQHKVHGAQHQDTMPAMDHSSHIQHMGHGDAMTSESPADRGIEWTDEMTAMNRASNDKTIVWQLIDTQTNSTNMDIDWQFKRGDFVKIRIYNDPKSAHPMQHPIHFHGQRFVVAAVNGKKSSNLVWKDSAIVRPGDTVDIVLEASNPGKWMAHCHISEHLHAGMMMRFNVSE